MNDELPWRLSIHEYVVRRLPFLRFSGEPIEEQERIARLYARNLAFEWRELLAEAARPGPIS